MLAVVSFSKGIKKLPVTHSLKTKKNYNNKKKKKEWAKKTKRLFAILTAGGIRWDDEALNYGCLYEDEVDWFALVHSFTFWIECVMC